MRIIRNGQKNRGSFVFKCDKCGCRYKANQCEYSYVRYSYESQSWVEANDVTEHIQSDCPTCQHTQMKPLYQKSKFTVTSSIRYLGFWAIGILLVLSFVFLAIIAEAGFTDEDSILTIVTCIYPLLAFVLCFWFCFSI